LQTNLCSSGIYNITSLEILFSSEQPIYIDNFSNIGCGLTGLPNGVPEALALAALARTALPPLDFLAAARTQFGLCRFMSSL
jgi:hypothetical protein